MISCRYLNDQLKRISVPPALRAVRTVHGKEDFDGGYFSADQKFTPCRAPRRDAAGAVVMVGGGADISAAAGARLSATYAGLHLGPAAARRHALRLPAHYSGRRPRRP